jgi:YD repeat-containing protein
MVRYPDPAVQILDPAYGRLRVNNAAVERLATGFRWAEGPVWFGDGRFLLWSDIPNNRIMRWEEETGAVSVFRRPSNNANGNTRDRQGRLVTCEHDRRRVTRTEYDGAITVVCDRYDGKRLNSPNDVVVKSDGSVWFTDPPFGILGHYEGHKAAPELPTNVYRIDPRGGEARVVTGEINRPNGLCFSPDESRLYVEQARVRELRRRHSRWLPLRHRGQPLVRMGRRRGGGRRGRVHARGDDGAAHPAAGALRQPLLRRPAPQPALHGGQPVALLAVRRGAGRRRRLSAAVHSRPTRSETVWDASAMK